MNGVASTLTRRQRFFREHPLCCFCGDAPTTTEDHVPGREFFHGRQWPEGYSFPACRACNAATGHDEMVVNILSRCLPIADDGAHADEFRKGLGGLANNFPEILRSLKPRANHVRRFLRENGLPRTPGTFLSDVPLLAVDRPDVHMSV